MVRTRSLSRRATRLAAIVPFLPMFAAACGGSDTIPDEPEDASTLDGATPDGGENDTSTDAGTDGTLADGAIVNEDGSITDRDSAADATDASEPSDGSEATDAKDGSEPTDGSEATDAKDGAEPTDGSDASEPTDAADASEPKDAGDASEPTDASDAGDASDGGDASDASDGGPTTNGILGSAVDFAVFSGATVSNATATVTTITGDLGTYPSQTAIGITPPVVIGNEYLGDGVAQIAANDIQTAYDKLSPGQLACGTVMTGLDLGGRTLTPGVYCFSSSAGLTGTLTLDAQNNPNASWVFQVGSALTTASASQVVVINGTAGQACNAYWQIGSSATLGTSSVFGGNILALGAVTVTTFTSVLGRTFGLSAEVSTDTNVISIALCAPSVPLLDAGLLDGDILDAFAGDAAKD